jgi:hypothetical protein
MMKMNWIVNAQGGLIAVWKMSAQEVEEQVCDSTQDNSHLSYVKKGAPTMKECIQKQCA